MTAPIAREVVIRNKLGLHARAAAHLVNLAMACQSEIELSKGGVTVNAKSIMGLLMLAAPRGSVLRLSVAGTDAEAAMAALVKLIEDDRFHEE